MSTESQKNTPTLSPEMQEAHGKIMAAIDQVEKVIIEVPEIAQETEPSFWEKIGAFFSELFGA